MSQRRTSFTDDYLAAIAAGRGSGRFDHYSPYLKLSDVPSQALSTKVPLLRLNKIAHVFSHSEVATLLQLEWDESIIEINEQFPLDPDKTIGICALLNIRHPADHGRNVVMTTDFVVTYDRDYSVGRIAYQVKATQREANQQRVKEKLKVEEEYWSQEGVPWKLLIASEFNWVLVNNLCELHQLRNMMLSEAALEEANDFWSRIIDDLNPEGSILELHVLQVDIGEWVFNGYQVAKLLLARKLKSAPIDTVPIARLRICDLREGTWH